MAKKVVATLKTGKTSISIADGNETISQVLGLTITDTPQEYSSRYCKNPPENTEQFNCNDEFFRGGWRSECCGTFEPEPRAARALYAFHPER